MTVQTVAAAYNRHQVSIITRAAARIGAQWATIDPADISGSWGTSVGPAMVATLTAAQRLAAASAPAYVQAALEAQGAAYDAQTSISPAGFSGTASDGRALPSLLYLPVIRTKSEIAAGLNPTDALSAGGRLLSMLTTTEAADAGRNAVQAQMVATPAADEYVRVVSGSACPRCIILAGRHYEWRATFKRHPYCNCTAVPVVKGRAADLTTDPAAFFEHLSPAEQDKRFGKADAQAIRDGADIAQVVNARRGLTERQLFGRTVQTTTEGMTRHGLASKALRANGVRGPRLSVGQIYADAGEDRDLALQLLRRYGYAR